MNRKPIMGNYTHLPLIVTNGLINLKNAYLCRSHLKQQHMKLAYNIIVIVLTFASVVTASSISSCNKGSGVDPQTTTTGYTCTCRFIHFGRDTTISYNYPTASVDSAKSVCNERDLWAKSIGGKTAACNL